ncbi:hypothetical protein BT96DRAFT_1020798 [Gymnopus androsaceus JB14]|uniref:Uncharacterized protein n=1 Tax=Gymnopus androsaceus JB14 TaxID=1447944 RepID=A0A6A4HFW2_9AGAR|nr:hypothetical protein BT96DRAFT_1020798 [Gymnopus androsaceus JB14]
MTDASVLAQHPPAVKVGGRRLSVNSRQHTHKPHVAPETDPSDSPSSSSRISSEPPAIVAFDDYPRPADPGLAQQHQDSDEPVQRHDKKHKEYNEAPLSQNKKHDHAGGGKGEDNTMPTRDHHGPGGKSFGAGGRISQPAGNLGI